jgi:hypothetical protein
VKAILAGLAFAGPTSYVLVLLLSASWEITLFVRTGVRRPFGPALASF